ncbi:GIY-YIG nuclease family protein [Flavobacterium sp. W20_MBD1_R3]|uniref:GIY-YIG nuclease family protein n=1 Tax=Flavobacterium sp. W20_MBD1_R3 TaxID=3240278 RepID=UPI003F8EF56C
MIIDRYFGCIIKNHQGLFYKGFTQEFDKRLMENNTNLSCHKSVQRRWALAYFKEFETKIKALKEELQLKKPHFASIERVVSNFQAE